MRARTAFHIETHKNQGMAEAAEFADEQRQIAEIGAAAAPDTQVDPQVIATPPADGGQEEAPLA